MMKLFLRNILLFFLPFILMIVFYIIYDPFMLYWHYDNLYEESNVKKCSNDAYRGIRWMKQYNDSMHYNSFIIGSSRSDFYYVEEWKKYIGQDAACFHFNQSGDNLLGTLQRVRYLYKRYDKIDNLLLIMDYAYLADMHPHKGHLFRQPWQVTKECDFVAFNLEFVSAMYSIDYLALIWGGGRQKKPYYYYIPQYNELHKDGAEQLLETNPSEYYQTLSWDLRLYERFGKDSISAPVIGIEQLWALNELHDLMEAGKTKYKIIISPLYDQISMSPTDIAILNEIFGKENVFDFSGINDYTNDVTNYYECSHYRPKLCNQILKIIYD